MNSVTRTASSAAALLLLIALPGLRAQLPTHSPSEVPPLRSICPDADGPDTDPTYNLRAQAFDDISAGDSAGARHLMRCAIRANPKDVVALQQEVYLDLGAHDERAASEDIDALRALSASTPELDAQQGYIFINQKNIPQARAAFGRAIAGNDPKIRLQAINAIKVLDGEFPRHLLELSLDSEYLTRFDDGIVDAYARYYERLGRSSPFSAYLNARVLRDTASQAGPLPQIFSDNALLGGVGLSFQPRGASYSIKAEANEAYVFFGSSFEGTQTGYASTVPDFRTEADYYRRWNPGDGRFYLEANGSMGFYSRYQHDGIAYLQPRESFTLLKKDALVVSPFLQQSFAFDTNQQFFNNTAELIPGIDFTLSTLPSVSFRTEYVRGWYLPIHTNSVNPYGLTYNDFRFRLIYQKSFSFGKGAE